MGKQLVLFSFKPSISKKLLSLITGNSPLELALMLAKREQPIKIDLLIACLLECIAKVDVEEFFDQVTVAKCVNEFEFYHLHVKLYELESSEFWFGIYDHQRNELAEFKFYEWTLNDKWHKAVPKMCKAVESYVYKNSFQFTNILKDIYK